MTPHPPHTPPLRTKRLTLRALHELDRQFVGVLISHPKVRAYLGGPIAAGCLDTHVARYLRDACSSPFWTIELDHIPIGLISLSLHKDGADHEISYQILPEYWRRGYGCEAATAVLSHAHKTMGLRRVIAETQEGNVASIALLRRLGFDFTATLPRFGAQQNIYAKDLTSL